MHFELNIVSLRKSLGLTQSQLARAASISLPFIQLIEAGKANPSQKVIEAILTPLGYRLSLQELEPDWAALAEVGVPLGHPKKMSWQEKASATCVRKAYGFLIRNPTYTREKDVLEAYLDAFQSHYPACFKKHFKNIEVEKNQSGRRIKLRRIALSNLAKIL